MRAAIRTATVTFLAVLVLGGCGSAVLAAAFPVVGIGLLGVALAFGLTVFTMAFAIGQISGCHLNPAVTLGLCVGRRFPGKEALPYMAARVIGAIAAAVYAVTSGKFGVGSLSNLVDRFQDARMAEKLQFVPSIPTDGNYSLLVGILILPIAVQWWNVWYPGAEPGGGGYVAQRMLSAKDEKNAVGATMMFNFLHYAVRPWPWILVALVSMLAFPMDSGSVQSAAKARLASPEMAPLVSLYDQSVKHEGLTPEQSAEIRRTKAEAAGISALAAAFPKVDDQFLRNDIAYPGMISRMPSGMLGLIVASLIAAYMSTIATHLNWGSSYIINDLYKRFIKKDADEKHYVLVSRIVTLLLVIISSLMIKVMNSISGSWEFIIECGAGLGLELPDRHGLPKNVLTPGGRPFIGDLGDGR